MNADIKGCLNNINRSYRIFEYNGKPMSKIEVQVVLSWALSKGLTDTKQIKETDIKEIIHKLNNYDTKSFEKGIETEYWKEVKSELKKI